MSRVTCATRGFPAAAKSRGVPACKSFAEERAARLPGGRRARFLHKQDCAATERPSERSPHEETGPDRDAFFLSGLAFGFAESKGAKTFEVAVSLPGSVEFFSVERKGMDKAAAEFGIKLTYSDAEWDAGKQLSQVENFAAKKVDLILLCAADNQALLPAVKVCKDAKIPLITFTNVVGPNPDGTLDGVVSYIGTNEVTIGTADRADGGEGAGRATRPTSS